jgi:hypothetical protein
VFHFSNIRRLRFDAIDEMRGGTNDLMFWSDRGDHNSGGRADFLPLQHDDAGSDHVHHICFIEHVRIPDPIIS